MTEPNPQQQEQQQHSVKKEKKKPDGLVIPPPKPKLSKAERRSLQASQRAAKKTSTNWQRNKMAGKNDIDYLCILDFEATCDTGEKPCPQEIIEFPVLLVDAASGEIIDTFHHYIKPDVHPTLSQFCTELTGIEQEIVDQGVSLFEALVGLQEWLDMHNLIPIFQRTIIGTTTEEMTTKKTFVFVTCGDWDLKTCLPAQLDHHQKSVPLHFKRWINLKPAFMNFTGRDSKKKSRPGMTGMLRSFNLDLLGRHHSGIDDCRNIAQICQHMIAHNWRPTMEMLSADDYTTA